MLKGTYYSGLTFNNSNNIVRNYRMDRDKVKLVNKLFKTNIGDLLIKNELGKGKSGYSYLAEFDNKYFVLKLMHNEPCSYYHFGDNKVILEINAYKELINCGILIPKMLDFNIEKKYIVKEFIDGVLAAELIAANKITNSILVQLFKMYNQAKNVDINIDYFPTNFIFQDQKLFYIDYECNPYKIEWDLPNWGIYYWANTKGFKKYLSTGCILAINESVDSGIPKRQTLEKKVLAWIDKYDLFKCQI